METENTNQNQHFRTFDVLSIVLSFCIVCGLTFLVFKKNLEQKKFVQAQTDVENLAQELILKPVNSSFYSKDRMPASQDSALGNDPWGNNYFTKVVKNGYGQPVYLVVLSAGPNKDLETEISDSVAQARNVIDNFKLSGDDIGYMKSYR